MPTSVLVFRGERDDQFKADTADTVFELREFFEKDTPPYAILSHRWGEEEILYQDMIPPAFKFVTQNKHGYAKLLGSCSLAQKQGYQWIWIDTCCIDKSSSAELTEAINSMYQWYGAAQVCYAYLDDVESYSTLIESKWFTRGWTLQELIAPAKVEFYSSRWIYIGTKQSLVRTISAKSGVDVQVLMGGDPLEMSVARRMYWASNRITTRVEDEAYCLLGLFGVNMPLIYGEGRKAFRRLQEEIIRLSDDQSILAWYATEESDGTPVDFLASRASDFQESGDIAAHPYHRTGKEAMTITSQGLSLEMVLLSLRRDETAAAEDGQLFGEVSAILDCQIGGIPGTFPTIILRRQPSGGKSGRRQHYYRIISSGFQSLFSTERTQFESCHIGALRDDTKLLIGLDPTQLDQDVYKESLDQSLDPVPWRQEHVIISRPNTRAFKQRLTPHAQSNQVSWTPWSLLLGSRAEADQTAFWFVLYLQPDYRWPKIEIIDVYPPGQFDASSRQLQTDAIPQKYYNLNRFKVIDGIIKLSVVTSRPNRGANSPTLPSLTN
ncbi:hypothetical protein SLS64_009899 [Diaporthe eres]